MMIEPNNTTLSAIYAGYVKAAEEPHREHLGASLIGKPCERELWYAFRWCDHEVFDGRMLRLFEVGKLAEDRFTASLRRAGLQVETHDGATGEQFRIYDHGGHFGGSLDGVALGVIEAPKTWHVVEYKTHSDKSFSAFEKNKVRQAKPLHFAQCQAYMGYTALDRALYVAENKNNSELYVERIEFSHVEFAMIKAKARRVIEATVPPNRIASDPSSHHCKYCNFSQICHGKKLPEVNCRTCAHSTPVVDESNDRKWHCAYHNDHVPAAFQRIGCDGHRYIPIFLEKSAAAIDLQDGVVIYEVLGTNETFGNGDGTNGTISSQELRAAGSLEAMTQAAEIKRQVPSAKVVA